MKDKLLIIGAGGHGKVVADIAIKMNRWQKIAFLDDNSDLQTSMGMEVIGSTNNAHKYIDQCDLFVGIGNNKIREEMQNLLETLGATIPTLVHPSAAIGIDVEIGAGTVVMAGAVINSGTRIGKGCIINTAATVDHDNHIDSYVHLSPGVHLGGTVHIGQGSWLGIGSVVINNVNIIKDCRIGAGAVVIRDITLPGLYVGVPVRRV